MSDIKKYEPLWGSWYVDSQLGEGSFGKVYKVHKEEFGKTYEAAVKIISIPQTEADLLQAKNDGLNDESAKSYFQAFVTDIIQEIDLMSAFRGNSNIVSLEDHKVIESSDGIGWDIIFRMELLETLSSHVNKKPLTQSDVIKLGIDICRALELCAMRKTIHRDIKPDNIFVSPYGDYKLGDFGIARQIERTMSGLSKKGTYTYMAPEVFKGDEYGASVDLYSLGIVMYRYLNKNRTPFLPSFPNPITPRDRDEALRKRMAGEAIPELSDEINPELSAITLKACAFERNNRFKDATEMRIALENLSGINAHEDKAEILIQKNDENKIDENKIDLAAPKEKIERTLGAIPDFGFDSDENEATRVIFDVKNIPEPEEIIPEPGIEIYENLIKRLGIFGGIIFSLLAILCLFSGSSRDLFIFLPGFIFCAIQCFLKFRSVILNSVFSAWLAIYLAFGLLADLRGFDYSFLILGLGLLSLWASKSDENDKEKSNKKRIILSSVLSILAIISVVMMINSIRLSSSEEYKAYVAGSAAVPFLMLLAAAAGFKDDFMPGGFWAMQFFPIIAFILYFVVSSGHAMRVLFYIANANFIGFSPERFSWWLQGRFLGLILEICAFVPLLALGSARIAPKIFMSAANPSERNKISVGLAIFVFIIAAGIFIIAMSL